MSTTDLAQCSKCAALLNDTDEDIAKHRRWHAQFEADFETIRRVASTASSDVRALTSTVRDLARPVVAAAPVALTIRVTEDEELEPDEDDLTPSTYADDDVTNTVTIANPTAGEPTEDAIDDLNTVPRLTAINDLA